ncbi:hypothetical protein CSV79_14425 [Sporosarcina sp. P13]|uniref:hypothetical protein n=1 Tax=Sporosarcina sp. P13 TaxID=2048263 RepID=UPI000C16687F|nr:hypothetical protein [Sporosarcina sp. P13]PIC62951.1 hypothetical protein CSV79_14425 [Sporosarcina sp. P13]
MNTNAEGEIELLKEQLEKVKQQDRILEEIENRLHKMKDIATYATDHRLSAQERNQLNKQMQEHQAAIKSVENYLTK